MAYGYRTENERVNNVVDFNAMKDNTLYGDSSMLHFPKWKADVPNKWVSVVCYSLQETLQYCGNKLRLIQRKSRLGCQTA